MRKSLPGRPVDITHGKRAGARGRVRQVRSNAGTKGRGVESRGELQGGGTACQMRANWWGRCREGGADQRSGQGARERGVRTLDKQCKKDRKNHTKLNKAKY